MKKIVECVPNISEGRDEKIINACADAVRKVSGVTLLDVDPGRSTNRTVFTFVGDLESVVEAAFQFSKTAYELIDMTKHSGSIREWELWMLFLLFRLRMLQRKNAYSVQRITERESVKNLAYRYIFMKRRVIILTEKC